MPRLSVCCRHLASHVLGRVLRRVEQDFEARYGYRPWLVETFVEPDRDGASFKAASFVCVGHSAGRGRQDSHHARARTVKSVYIYELTTHWRRHLGVARVDAAPSLSPGEGLDSRVWAANEFGGAPLGDKRLSARLVTSAGLLAECPGHALTGHPDHDRAAVKGYYRLIDHPAQSQVTPANIVAPHRARTVQRMRAHDTVLCIQDGTDLTFATRPGCEGLSIIGRNQTSAETLGLHLHVTLAVSGAGLPLGVLRCGFDEPPQGESEHGAKDNKMQRWLEGLRDVAVAASQLGTPTRVLSVMDREADFFELFDEQRRVGGGVDVLVRAKHDRRLGEGVSKLFATLRNAPADGYVEIEIGPPERTAQVQPQAGPPRAPCPRDAHDAARSRGAAVRRAADVHRHGAALPHRLRRPRRAARAMRPRRRGAPGRHPRRIPEPQA